MGISKIERGVDFYNKVLNSDKAKLIEQNKELYTNIEKYQEENEEILSRLENKEQELEIMNKNYEIIQRKMRGGMLRYLEKSLRKMEKNIMKKAFDLIKK